MTASEPELRRVCAFLGIDWHEPMLRFHETPHRVRSASVWQVREPVYTRLVGRLRHYAVAGALADPPPEEPADAS